MKNLRTRLAELERGKGNDKPICLWLHAKPDGTWPAAEERQSMIAARLGRPQGTSDLIVWIRWQSEISATGLRRLGWRNGGHDRD